MVNHHAIISISEETKHDADLAIAFENRPLETLESRGANIEEIHEQTDGCPAQNKVTLTRGQPSAGRRSINQRRAIGGTVAKAGRCLSHAQATLILP